MQTLKSALPFLTAVGASYSLIWTLGHLISSSSSPSSLSCSSSHQHNKKEGKNSCEICSSRFHELKKKQQQQKAGYSSSSSSSSSSQRQLLFSVLERLLQDRGIDVSSNTSSTSSSSATSTASRRETHTCNLMVPLPVISLPSSSPFESLESPSDFYASLLKNIATAKRRIIITSLYIGSGPRSKRLVAAIEQRLKDVPELELLIVLDYCRMHIGPNLLAIRPIVNQIEENNNQKQQRVVLFCPPSEVGRLVRRFGRAREAQGVQHTKLFVFDDDVILSGANLSDDYFLDRMDRYVSISRCADLANHMCILAHALAKVSFPVVQQQQEEKDSTTATTKRLGAVKNPFFGFEADQPTEETRKFFEGTMLEFEKQTCVPLHVWLDALDGEEEQKKKEEEKTTYVVPSVQFARAGVFTDLSVVETLLSFDNGNVNRVIASPYLNTHHGFLDRIFQVCERRRQKSSSSQSSSSPAAAFTFVTCSPESNAWKGSKGLAAGLPQLYYSLVRSFYFLAEDRGFISSQLVDVREFEKHHLVDPTSGEYSNLPEGVTASAFSPYVRPDDEEEGEDENSKKSKFRFPSPSPSPLSERKVASATFHAKGVWFQQQQKQKQKEEEEEEEEEEAEEHQQQLPFATVLGSNNLGERCVFKDVESDFVLVTCDKNVQRVLRTEVDAILKHSSPVSREAFLSNGKDEKLGRFQPVVEVVGSMMSSYL